MKILGSLDLLGQLREIGNGIKAELAAAEEAGSHGCPTTSAYDAGDDGGTLNRRSTSLAVGGLVTSDSRRHELDRDYFKDTLLNRL